MKDTNLSILLMVIQDLKAECPEGFPSIGGYSYQEYDNCIKELSEAAWMNNGIPFNIEARKTEERLLKTVKKQSDNNTIKWKNGNECVYQGDSYTFECIATWGCGSVSILSYGEPYKKVIPAHTSKLSKPETEAQKAEREREEMAKALYYIEAGVIGEIGIWEIETCKAKLRYRKMIDAGVTVPLSK